jgi:hypothetical protein
VAHLPNKIQVAKSLSENASLITSPPFFVGDFRQLSVSVSTQSAGALNIQMSNADGLQSAIPENSWANVLTPSVNSVFAITTGPRWSRSSSQAASNHTIIFSGRA